MSTTTLAENFEMSRFAVPAQVRVSYMAAFVLIQNVGREQHGKINRTGYNDVLQRISYFDRYWFGKLKTLEKLMNRNHKKTGNNRSIY